jgi:hypothetical protein
MKTIPMSEVKEFYARNQPNGHWFDRRSMKFFNTRLPRVAYEGNAGILFVTSETDPSGKTAYSVRKQAATGDIDTVGEFHGYPTSQAARDAIRAMHA